MKEKINNCFERLQMLDIKPTMTNMEILLQTLYDLREIYNELEKEEKSNGGNKDWPTGDFK